MTRAMVRILGASLALGIAADHLLRAPVWGVNVALGVTAIAVCAILPVWADPGGIPDAPADPPWEWLGAMFFAGMWAVRDADLLLAADLLAAGGLLALPLLRATGRALAGAGALDLLAAPFRAVWRCATGPMELVTVARQQARGRPLPARHARGVVLGAALAVPPLFVFSALFASADPVFQSALGSMHPGPFASHAALIAPVAWATTGYLWTLSAGRPEPAPRTPVLALGATPVMVPLAATAGLFTIFLATQAGSLFGGPAFVESHGGLTYAEYARGGFFQLVIAALLVLPMVYAAPLLAAPEAGGDTRSLRALMTVQLGLTALVLVSALWRLGLYVQAYGLTEDRLYGLAVIGWIGGVLGIFAGTVLRGIHRSVAIRCVVAAAIVLATLNLSNPAALIARYNLSHDRARHDVTHLARLGPDAIPTIVSRMSQLPRGLQCELTGELRERLPGRRDADWRGWNLGRARARAAVGSLPDVPCP